jgi:hypothetical protein
LFLLGAMANKTRLHDVHILQELLLHSDCDASATASDSAASHESESSSDSDVDRQMDKPQWTVNRIRRPSAPVIHRFTGGSSALRLGKDSTPLSVFMLFFLKIIQLLAEEANRYYHQYLDTFDEGLTILPDMTIHKMHFFILLHVGFPWWHDLCTL